MSEPNIRREGKDKEEVYIDKKYKVKKELISHNELIKLKIDIRTKYLNLHYRNHKDYWYPLKFGVLNGLNKEVFVFPGEESLEEWISRLS